MRAEYGSGIGPVKRQHVFSPCQSVEQTAPYQRRTPAGIRQILMEHQQVIAEIKVCLARIFRRQRPSAKMIHFGRRNHGYLLSKQQYTPAQIDFFHVGEKRRIKSTGLHIHRRTHHQARSRGPEHLCRSIVLPTVRLALSEYAPSAVRIAVTVEETAACSGILKSARITLRQYFGLAGSRVRICFHI